MYSIYLSCRNQAGCDWMYSGQGWEYQILAGPAFIVVFTISGILMGFLADRWVNYSDYTILYIYFKLFQSVATTPNCCICVCFLSVAHLDGVVNKILAAGGPQDGDCSGVSLRCQGSGFDTDFTLQGSCSQACRRLSDC